MSIASNSTVIILGSTGSIGTQGLDVISRHPERFTVTGLAAGGAHIELLAQQAAQFHVSEVAVFDETKVPALQAALAQAGAQGVRVTGASTGRRPAATSAPNLLQTSSASMFPAFTRPYNSFPLHTFPVTARLICSSPRTER